MREITFMYSYQFFSRFIQRQYHSAIANATKFASLAFYKRYICAMECIYWNVSLLVILSRHDALDESTEMRQGVKNAWTHRSHDGSGSDDTAHRAIVLLKYFCRLSFVQSETWSKLHLQAEILLSRKICCVLQGRLANEPCFSSCSMGL